MKILISGMTGFVGGHIAKYLGSLGHEVEEFSKAEFMNQDYSRLDDFRLDGKGDKAEYVIHCAWSTKLDIHSTNHMLFAEWTCHFLDECKSRGINVINIGSSSEYGVKYEPMREDMACEPINTYGIAKLAVTLYAKKLGYNTLRIFSPYGRGGKNFVSMYKKVDKYGNPNDNRDFQSVELVCQAVERLLHAKHLYGEIINVCSGENKKNGDIAKKSKNWYKYPQGQYEPSLWVGSPDKMKRLLNI